MTYINSGMGTSAGAWAVAILWKEWGDSQLWYRGWKCGLRFHVQGEWSSVSDLEEQSYQGLNLLWTTLVAKTEVKPNFQGLSDLTIKKENWGMEIRKVFILRTKTLFQSFSIKCSICEWKNIHKAKFQNHLSNKMKIYWWL